MKRVGPNQWLKVVLAVCLVLTSIWPAICRASNPVEPAIEVIDAKESIRLGDLLQLRNSESGGQHINAILGEAFSPESAGESWKFLNEKKVVFISAKEAALYALRKNLSIQVNLGDSEAAKEAILEAEAVFDPVLRFSISYSESDTHERGAKEVALITRSWAGTTLDIPTNPNRTDPQVNQLKWIKQAPGNEVTRELNASEDQDNGPTKTFQYTIGISQQLPWGPSMDISLVTTDREVYYDSRGHSYGTPWTSSALFNLMLPLPWTKGFGRNAPQDIALKQRIKDSERSSWSVKSSINSILTQVDLTYWDMVQSFEFLNNAIENKKLVEQQQELVQKRFDEGEATNYDKLQVDAEMANAFLQEERARDDLLAKCYALSVLLVDEPDETRSALYLPVEYLKDLDQTTIINIENALETALKKRPDLQAAAVGKDRALISERLAQNQKRPDISLRASFNVAQDGSAYGYEDPLESWGSIGEPDSLRHSYSLLYNYPLFNRALKSAWEIRKTAVKDQDLFIQTTENQIIKEVNDALAQVYSAQERIASARKIVQFAEFNYKRIQSREVAETNQYEVILNLQRLNTSKLTLISALVDLKKAITRLQAAQGTIAEEYVKALSHNPMERLRLDIMTANGLLKYFRPTGQAASNSTSIQ